ncbi:MAG: hypothetical protein ACYSU7_11910, partial [Planctomycetota bacterium]
MNVKTLAVAAGFCAPLILTGSSVAKFLGISAVTKPNSFGVLVVNVYAEFDNPGHDWMQVVAGTAHTPLGITVDGGTFYAHQEGGDTAPSTASIEDYPSLAYDSFYTIGMKAVAPGVEDFTYLVHMPPLVGTSVYTANGGWAAVPPDSPQGNPFDPVHCFPGNGQVLIGQFSTIDGVSIGGSFLMQFVSDGIVSQSSETFGHAPPVGLRVTNLTQGTRYSTIQAAIAVAASGNVIEASWGTYNEAINFYGKAITVRSADGPEVTVIDGNGALHVVQCVSGEGPDTVLEGFTITGGNADGLPGRDQRGGGMYNENGSRPTVTNCTFSGNSAV